MTSSFSDGVLLQLQLRHEDDADRQHDEQLLHELQLDERI
jgi:hypothetical protein